MIERMINESVTLDARFCGPPDSGNGGVTVGHLARRIDGPAKVTLRAPPPLGVAMQLTGDEKAVSLDCGAHRIGEAVIEPLDATPFRTLDRIAVDIDRTRAAEASFAGFTRHAFPTCFVCGPERREGDGLRLFAAPLEERVTAAWCPAASLADEHGRIADVFLYAALDCPSYFALRDPQLVALLGRMHAEVIDRPRPGDQLVVDAWALAREGRKRTTAVALRNESGDVLARAVNIWIEIDGAVPQPPVPSVTS
ncbi:MAG: hypothetical protein AAF610_15270 [Pseudomonadota bacterium]